MRLVSPATGTRTPIAFVLLLALLPGACGSPAGPTATAVPATATPPPSAIVATPSTPSPATPTASPSQPAATAGAVDRPDLASARVETQVVVDGLDSPLWVGPIPDGSGRLAVAEQAGRLRVVQGGELLPGPYLDIADRVAAGGERGLLGVAFPPGFGAKYQAVYIHYSDLAGDTTIAAVDAPAGAATLDPSTVRVLLSEPQPYANHNGGWVGFDRDGMLLIALGDGGSGGDPENRASRLDTILGKILRIDVLGASGEPYAIPPDNPFVGRADARPEILHYGLRNPFRDSIDPATGVLWIGDVGQNAWEEVDVAPAGAGGLDFGWRRWEGRHCYDPPTGCDPTGVTMPVTEYPHEAGCAVIGGVVYHGEAIPALRGAYLFSDNCSGTLWAIDAGLDAPQAPITLVETGRAISSIGVDEAGEVYLTDLAGALLRLASAS